MEFSFQSKAPDEKARLLSAFEAFAREKALPDSVRRAADLAIEEHITNILSYAFMDECEHTIDLKFSVGGGEFSVEISDDGIPFDLTHYPEPNLSIPAEQRKIGGLGIHMIRQSMDALDYRRVGNRNVLRMRKRLTS